MIGGLGPLELIILVFIIILIWRITSRRSQKQQDTVVPQSNHINQSSENTSNVINNVTYNIHDSAIAGDINTTLDKQND
jgi:hypothetical protein